MQISPLQTDTYPHSSSLWLEHGTSGWAPQVRNGGKIVITSAFAHYCSHKSNTNHVEVCWREQIPPPITPEKVHLEALVWMDTGVTKDEIWLRIAHKKKETKPQKTLKTPLSIPG